MSKKQKKPKLVYGWGINDADYVTRPTVNGKEVWCPYFRSWKGMIKRCYDPQLHKKRPTYIGCSIVEEWRSFMAFRSWMMQQQWQGLHLDKDILQPGNKAYSPDTCVFVSHSLNNLLVDSGASRGEYPIGVYWNKQHRKYQATCCIDGKNKHLGYFSSPDQASRVYIKAKAQLIAETALKEPPRIRNGLLLHRDILQATLFV